MKIFIVDNSLSSVTSFLEAIGELNWAHTFFPVKSTNNIEDRILQFLSDVCKLRPDVVVLDAALDSKEEKLVDELELKKNEVSEES